MPGVAVSPYIYTASDGLGHTTILTVNYDNGTKAITSASAFRDPGSVWTHVYFGLGANGTPEATLRVFNVPAGTTTANAAQMSAQGFNVIADIFAGQITAGP